MPREITLHYFHGRGIGEPIRLLLAIGEIDFTDRRYDIDEFAKLDAFKAKLPFGQMPALEVDGALLGQTDSIARLAARLAGLYPADPVDAARSDMIVVHQAEIQSAIAKMIYDGVPGAPGTRMLPNDEGKRRIAEFFAEKLPGLLARLERLAGSSYMVGEQLSWADVCVFNRLNHLLDTDENVLGTDLPRLQTVYDNVHALPSVRKWIETHAADYPRLHGN